MRIEIEFEKLQSNFATIRSIIPGFSAPEAFNQLGDINFIGRYDLLFGANHILDGQINTDVGRGDLDMELDLTDGPENAEYEGKLAMYSFDLKKWTGNKDFGNASFNIRIAEGSTGLTLKTMKARILGSVDTLHYKGYRYTNMVMNGKLDNYIFDGKFGVKDPNIDFDFDGKVNLKEQQTQYDFTANIRKIDLKALYLIDRNWVISANIPSLALRMTSLSDLTGEAKIKDFKLIENDTITHDLSDLEFRSGFSPKGQRQFFMVSEIADALFEGQFDPLSLGDKLTTLFAKHHPKIAGKLGWVRNDSLVLDDLVNYNLTVKNSKSWAALLDPQLDTLKNISLIGRIDMKSEFAELNVNIPSVTYNGVRLSQTDFDWKSIKDDIQFTLLVPQTKIGKRPPIEPLRLTGISKRDKLQLEFRTLGTDSTNIIKNINLKGDLTVVDSLWQMRFNSSAISLFNEPWYIANDNYIRFDNEYFAANNFELGNDGNQRIRIDSLNEGRGLVFSLTNFDLSFINRFFESGDSTSFYRGKIYDLELFIQDVYEMEDLAVYLTTDSVFIDNKSYGDLTGNFELKNLESPLAGKLFLNDGDRRVRVAAAWLPENEDENEAMDYGEFDDLLPGTFQAHVQSWKFPVHILESIVPEVTNTGGDCNMDVWLQRALQQH